MIPAALVIWVAKYFALVASERGYESFLIPFAIFGLNLLSVFVLLNHVRAQAARRANALSASLHFAAIVVLPLAPDVFAALQKESVSFPWLWFAGFFVLAVLLLGIVRAPLFWLMRVGSIATAPRALLCLFGFHLTDALVVSLAPTLYWPALALPVRLPPPQMGVASPDAPKVVLVNPRVTDTRRHELAEGGLGSLYAAAENLAAELAKLQLPNHTVILLPETTLYASPSEFVTFSRGVFAGLDPSKKIALIGGARHEGHNVIYGAANVAGVFSHTTLRLKSDAVPFFERAVGGLQTRSQEEPADEHALGGVDTRKRPLFICYEAMNYRNWKRGEPSIVFTNHYGFAKFGVISRLYDYNLRLMAWAFGSPLVLVGNFGTNAAYGHFPDLSMLGLSGSFEPLPPPVFQALELKRGF